MAISSKSCEALRSHIYTETGRIQALAEQYIDNSRDYVKQKLPQTTFDAAIGESPVSLRYRSAMPENVSYLDVLKEGSSNELDYAPDCSNTLYGFNTSTNNRGSAGCNLPSTTITAGYDTFGRSLKGRAWQTNPTCAMDLLLKNHASAYIEMLRRDLPKRGMEFFNEALEDEVIAASNFNFSAVGGWTYAAGQFPAIPEGTLDIGYLKRIKRFFVLQGVPESEFEIEVGRDAFEAAVRAWNTANNYQIHITKLDSNVNNIIGRDMVEFEGVKVVLTDTPTRGYLRQVAGGYQFVRVPRAINRAGTGGGIVAEPNPDYLNCFTFCDGEYKELYELGFHVHSTFAERQALAPVQLAGLKMDAMNMEVRFFDGNWIDCNEDNTKFFLRMSHMYGFRVRNPELGGAFLYRVAPQPIRVTAGTCETGCETVTDYSPVGMADLPPPPASACWDEQSQACDDVVHYAEAGGATEPGEFRFVGLSGYLPTGAGTAVVYVERFGGWEGAATVDVDSASGTATSGVDFTAVNETLSWQAGENGVKPVTVTSLAASTAGQNWTLALSGATGATIDADSDTYTFTYLPACT